VCLCYVVSGVCMCVWCLLWFGVCGVCVCCVCVCLWCVCFVVYIYVPGCV